MLSSLELASRESRLTPLEEEKLETRGEVGHLLGYEVAEYRMKLRDYRVTVAQWTRTVIASSGNARA